MKKTLKNLLTAVMTTSMITAAIPLSAGAENAWQQKNDTVDMRVAVISDCHVESENKSAWFKNILGDFKVVTNKLDAVAMVGDIIYTPANGTVESMTASYNVVKNAYNSIIGSDVPYIWTMGNHEIPVNVNTADAAQMGITAFAQNVGNPVSVKEINGYTFITANPDRYNGHMAVDTQNQVMALAKEAIDADASKTKPVFLLIHHPTNDIIFGENALATFGYTDEFYQFLRTTPQIVFISGHEHNTAHDPRMVTQYQGGYSMISSPFSANGELWQFETTALEPIATNNDKTESSETMLIETKNNVVTVYRMDNIGNKFIGEPMVLDIPSMVNGEGYNYTNARYEKAKAPSFNSGASVSATAKDDTTISVTFSTDASMPESFPGAQDDFVYSYQIDLWNKDKDYVIKSFKIFGDFWRQDNDKPSSRTVEISSVDSGETYTVCVSPVSVFQKVGNSIETTVTMTGEIKEDTRIASAKWDMQDISGNSSDGYFVSDTTKNDNKIFPYYTSTFTNDYIGTSKYSSGKYISMKHGPFFIYDKKTDGTYTDSLSENNAILKAIDSQFTFETWIYIPSADNTSQISSIFDVHFDADSSRANTTRVCSLQTSAKAADSVDLTMRRSYESGETYYYLGKLPKDEWAHVLVSYDCEKASNKPFAVINGVVQEIGSSQLNASGEIVKICGTADKDNNGTNDARRIEFARQLPEWGTPVINNPKYAYTEFYQGLTSTTQALKDYYSRASEFEKEFNIEISDIFGNVLKKSDLEKMLTAGNSIAIDFSGADTQSVTKDNVYIADKTDNVFVDYTGSWNESTYTISEFELKDKHNYELVIKGITDNQGNSLRSKAQIVEFTANEATTLTTLASYEFDPSIFTGKPMYQDYLLNDKNGGSVPLIINFNNNATEKTNHDLTDSPEAFVMNYPEMKIENKDFAKKLDKEMTYETFFKINKASEGAPFRYDMSGLLMIGGDNASFGNGYMKIYAGRTAANSNEAYLYFIRNAKAADGTVLFKRWYAVNEDGSRFTVTTDKYYHLVASFDSTSTANEPVLYINGVKYKMSVSEASNGYPGEGFTTSDDMTNYEIRIGKLKEGSTNYYTDMTWAMSNFYDGIATSYDARRMYNAANKKFIGNEKTFGISVTAADGSTVKKENYQKLHVDGNTITINFTGADKTKITKDNVYITDITENKAVDFTGTWDGNNYIISNLALTDKHKYNLAVKNIYDETGAVILKSQIFEFACLATELVTLAKYEFDSSIFTGQLMYRDYSLNDKNGGNVPLMVNYNYKDFAGTVSPNVIGSPETFKSNYPELKVSDIAFARKLDGKMTYETYFKMDKASESGPFKFDMSGLLMAGGDTTGFGDGQMKIYVGRTATDSNEGYLYFIKNAKASDGAVLYKRWYAAKEDGSKLRLSTDKYYHLAVSFDSTSTNSEPIFYVDGVKYKTVVSEASNGYPGVGFYTADDMATDSAIHIGKISRGGHYTDMTWAMSSFYEGIATDYDVQKMYDNAKIKYEEYDVKFIAEDGTVITADSIASANEAKASVTVTSKKTAPTVIMAVYNNGRLKDVKTGALTSEAKDAYVWETDFANIESGDTLKVMCWDSLGNMVPILSTEDTLTK